MAGGASDGATIEGVHLEVGAKALLIEKSDFDQLFDKVVHDGRCGPAAD